MKRWIELLARRRIAVAYIYMPVFYWLARPTAATLVAGVVPVLAGLALRLWASGYLRKGEALTQQGPYGLCRNPLYLGSFLLLLGLAIASGSLLLLAGSPALFLLFYLPTMWREERELAVRFGSSYGEYSARVPRLVPRWPPPDRAGAAPWSWNRASRHREPMTTGLALIAYGLLMLKL
jgi:protein-S-isoprenylcysteine O-methyltransferase Ste14